jgi:hypothetical protein
MNARFRFDVDASNIWRNEIPFPILVEKDSFVRSEKKKKKKKGFTQDLMSCVRCSRSFRLSAGVIDN